MSTYRRYSFASTHPSDPQTPAQRVKSPSKSNSAYKFTVEKLWEAAKAKQAFVLGRQSQTIEGARVEYLKRYQIPPPNGFDKWFTYARKHESLIIDEFDNLMESLLPFRAYQENQCQFRNTHDLIPGVLPVCIVNGTVDAGDPSVYHTKDMKNPFIDFTSDFVSELPDMCFYINTFDEPRLVIPIAKHELLVDESNQNHSCEKHEFTNFKRTSIWEQAVVPCSNTSAAKNSSVQPIHENVALVESWDLATDLCYFAEAPPAGMLRCPENMSITSAARPILSAASLSTFSDIMYPTLWRWRFDAQPADITPWEEKLSSVGWRGSSNGGYAMGENWKQFQRHRMVRLATGGSSDKPYAMKSTDQLQQWLDVRFTNIEGCEDAACKAMKEELHVVESQNLTETFKNKIVLDMDGHGLSGRFYMLLQSDSAVMKQGIVREWHDSRLRPWLHYIPLSMQMYELEPLLEYLLGEGDDVLKSIAMESKDWAAKALRKQDMRIYMYRLMLELGRKTFK